MTHTHQNQPIRSAGASLEESEASVVLLHGRGATADSILELAGEFRNDLAYLAPQAAGNEWYPNSFLMPIESNEPELSSALQLVGNTVQTAVEAGNQERRVMLLGFSQGACLACEYVARNPMRYGGVAVLSGGLIGDQVHREEYQGDLDGTPVFLGCGDNDPHIPLERIGETKEVFEAMNGDVTQQIYRGMGHGVNQDEVRRVSQIIDSL